jgi:hypothetical protein
MCELSRRGDQKGRGQNPSTSSQVYYTIVEGDRDVGCEDEGNANGVRRRAAASRNRESSKIGGLQKTCGEDSVAGCRDEARYHIRYQSAGKRGE